MTNINEFEEFSKNAYELISERENLKRTKENILLKEKGERTNTLYFPNIDIPESEEELSNRIILFQQKWDNYIEECFKAKPFLFRLKYIVGINNIKNEDERQKIEDYERKIIKYTEIAAKLYSKLEEVNLEKQKKLSR